MRGTGFDGHGVSRDPYCKSKETYVGWQRVNPFIQMLSLPVLSAFDFRFTGMHLQECMWKE